jgi:hypothetical protein
MVQEDVGAKTAKREAPAAHRWTARRMTAHHQAAPALTVWPAMVTAQTVMVPMDTLAPMAARPARCSRPSACSNDLMPIATASSAWWNSDSSQNLSASIGRWVRHPEARMDDDSVAVQVAPMDTTDRRPAGAIVAMAAQVLRQPPMTVLAPAPTVRRREPPTKTSPALIKQP